MKIVSGGQTGVDQAALDAALELGIDAGGWCPEGRLCEDGIIPKKYPVTELPDAGYRKRTKQNVIDSDATLIICFNTPTGGTKQTIDFCISEQKLYILVDAKIISPESGAKKTAEFIKKYNLTTLNIAGPRASTEPSAYTYAKTLTLKLLQLLSKDSGTDGQKD